MNGNKSNSGYLRFMDFQSLRPDDQRLAGPWQLAPNQGRESTTWFSDQWVLQKRSLGALKNIRRSQKILHSLAEHRQFQSARGEIITTPEGCFYLLSKRLPGLPLSEEKLRAWKEIKPLLGEIKGALQQLQNEKLSPAAYLHPRNPVVLSLLADRHWIAQGLQQKLGVSVDLPPEPQGPLALGHGDLGTHNLLIGGEEIFFIDWDTVSALPRHSDSAYLIQNILYRLDLQHWPEILAASYMLADYLTYQQWVNAVLGSLARSAVIWPKWHPGREGVLKKLPEILPQLY